MIAKHNDENHADRVIKKAEMPENYNVLAGLPSGSEIKQIAFVSERVAGQQVLLEFPHPIQRWAVLAKSDPDQQQTVSADDLLVLTIPASNQEDSELLEKVREWVDAANGDNLPNSLMMTLQGAQIFWAPGRLAIQAQSDRLATVRAALIEACFYEAELRDIERTLGEAWPQLEADMPQAFEFDEASISKRQQLRKRFQQILLIRARLARIAPHVHCPHLHPPTLASQVGERLRERTRMVHRHEFLDEQIEVFEKVYESCGQRTSDFMLARSGHKLEWVIIVLLATQILLTLFEILSSAGSASLGQ